MLNTVLRGEEGKRQVHPEIQSAERNDQDVADDEDRGFLRESSRGKHNGRRRLSGE